jgi:NAD(P)-dependent dehydrogenase (short-subunit alcohol dehydrogenase family)
MFRLDHKIAVVIGGAGGIGEACAFALAHQGAMVTVASRDLEKLEKVAKKIKKEIGPGVSAAQVDVTNEGSVTALKDRLLQNYGTVDILVNAEGLNVKMLAVDTDMDTWDSLFSTNVRGVMLACKIFGKAMIEKKRGKIINLSSVRGIRGVGRGNTIYGATKGAVDMITRNLAAEWAEYNINVNAIGPSLVITEMIKKAYANNPERLETLRASSLLKRFATPEDVAAACVFLASPETDFITGQIIYVDGGLTAVG